MPETAYLYNRKYFSSGKKHMNDKARLSELFEEIMETGVTSVLDVGCGTGNLVKMLSEAGIRAVGIDFALDLRDIWNGDPRFAIADARCLPFRDKEFDMVFSSDFLEHIPTEDIDQVVEEMHRVGNMVMARIAYERKLTKRQSLYHCTNKPKEWWIEKLSDVILI